MSAPFVELRPDSARPGTAVNAVVRGYAPAAEVSLIWVSPQGQRQLLAAIQAGDDGTAFIPFVVPYDGADGERAIEIHGSGSNAPVRATFTVSGAPPEITAP